MINGVFTEEKNNMKILINAKNSLQNFSYRLSNDLNAKEFFTNVIENIKKFDSLSDDVTSERMFKYHFVNDLKEMREVLHLFFSGLQSKDDIKSRTSEELIKCCRIFPDNIGKRIIRQISYIPLLDLFHEKQAYLEYLNNKINLDEKSMGQTPLEYQKESIFSDSLFSKKFPKDEDFIDYAMRNRYVEILEKEYFETKRDEINNALNILIEQYEKHDKAPLIIGSAYWDNKQKINSSKIQAFKDVVNAMTKTFKKNELERISKLEFILQTKIEDDFEHKVSIIKSLKIENTDGGLITIDTNSNLSQNEIDKICKIFIVKDKMELIHISFLNNIDEKSYVFKCKLALN